MHSGGSCKHSVSCHFLEVETALFCFFFLQFAPWKISPFQIEWSSSEISKISVPTIGLIDFGKMSRITFLSFFLKIDTGEPQRINILNFFSGHEIVHVESNIFDVSAID